MPPPTFTYIYTWHDSCIRPWSTAPMPTAGMGSPALMPTTWHGVSSPHLKDHANSLGKRCANHIVLPVRLCR